MDQETAEKFAGSPTRTMEEVVGVNLTRYREREGISQAQLGRRIGSGAGRQWSRQAVSLAESGKRTFGVTDLVTICQGTGLTMADLLTIPDKVNVDLGGDVPAPGFHLNGRMGLSALTREKIQELHMNGYHQAVYDMRGHLDKVQGNLDKWYADHKAQDADGGDS